MKVDPWRPVGAAQRIEAAVTAFSVDERTGGVGERGPDRPSPDETGAAGWDGRDTS